MNGLVRRRRADVRPLDWVYEEPGSLFKAFWDDFSFLSFQDWVPAIDVVEDEKNYLITAELPGLSKDSVNIKLDNDVLTISGEKRDEREEGEGNYSRIERSYGSFSRSFKLSNADYTFEDISASVKDGILRLKIPKKGRDSVKEIKITE